MKDFKKRFKLLLCESGMRRALLILLSIIISVSVICQSRQSSYLGEARWKKTTPQQGKQPLDVKNRPVSFSTNTSKDSTVSMVQEPINPQTYTIHMGPTRPVVQSIIMSGKKLKAPKVYTAPPLLHKDNAQFNISYTDKRHGFPKAYTTDMAEDNEHNIWMATDDGLIRYDGTQYFVYDQSNGLPDLYESSIAFDKQKRLWIASSNGAYFIRNDSVFSIQSKDINFSTISCSKVEMDRLDHIWISTTTIGVIRIETNGISIFDKRCGLPVNSFNTVMVDTKGDIYLGSSGFGLIQIEKDKMRHFFKKSKKIQFASITSLIETEDGIWAGSFLDGLFRMGKKDTVHYSIDGKFKERIFGLGKRSTGIWISYFSKGLCYFDKKKLLFINQNNGLVTNFPYRVFTDSFKNLWVCSGSSGFSRVNETNFYQTIYSNPNIGFVNKIIPDNDKSYWITTYGRSLFKIKGSSATSYAVFPKANILNNVLQYTNDALFDQNGSLWIAIISNGIIRYKNEKFELLSSPSIAFDWNTPSIKMDTMHSIWFNPFNAGLIQYDNNQYWQYTEKAGLLSKNVTRIFLDKGKNIHWSFSDGFQRMIGQTIETFYIGNQPFTDKVNEMISLDQNSHLLATATKGLLLIDHGKVYQISFAQGIASNNIKTMIQDRTNKIWITTEKSLESFRIHHTSVTDHEVYNESNGPYVMDVKYAVMDTTGFPFWSEREYKLVHDSSFKNTITKSPIISYTKIESGNQVRSEKEDIYILPNEKIKIDYKTIDWGRENNLKLSYLLISANADTTERSIQNSGNIIISDLIPGSYRILIKTMDHNAEYYSQPLTFNVREFWYNTLLFRIVFACLVITGITFYFLKNARRQSVINKLLENKVKEQTTLLTQEKDALLQSYKTIDQQNKEKDILIDEINHRVKNNLQFISAMVEMQILNNNNNNNNEALVDTSRRIKAMSLVHELLYNKNEQDGLSMKAYILELSENLKEMALGDSNPINIEMEIEDLMMDSKTALSLGMIISELVSNSFKHAFDRIKEPKVFIKLSKEKSTGIISLVVIDNGNGYQLNTEKKGGLGSRLVDIFSRQLEGEYTIESNDHFSYVLQFKPIES